jgi:hypothetical protein
VALIRGGEILPKWRRAIQEAVSEGKNYKQFSRTLLPTSNATCDAHQVTMKLIQFEFVDIFSVPLPVKPTKGEREYTTSVRIVKNTKLLEPVQVTYHERPDNDNNNESTTDATILKKVEGTAIKRREGWNIFLVDGWKLETSETERKREMTLRTRTGCTGGKAEERSNKGEAQK